MYKRSVMAAVAYALASASAKDAPQVSLSVPSPFATEVTVKRYRKGQDLLHDPTFHLITVAPLTEYHGWFGSRVAHQVNMYVWKVDLFARYSPKGASASSKPRDGYEADLSIEPDFFD